MTATVTSIRLYIVTEEWNLRQHEGRGHDKANCRRANHLTHLNNNNL